MPNMTFEARDSKYAELTFGTANLQKLKYMVAGAGLKSAAIAPRRRPLPVYLVRTAKVKQASIGGDSPSGNANRLPAEICQQPKR
jgi:hypothetical protein